MITYFPNDPLPGGKYGFSYRELREDYLRYALMSDDDFIANLTDALHFACYVCYIKEMGSDQTLSDEGVIHQLIHLLSPKTRELALQNLQSIRDLFNHDCCLA